MAERTSATENLPRDELAAYLRGLADEFERDGETVDVDVGNKTITLEPPEEIDTSVDVVEQSSRFRGRRETVRLELSWKP